ncbi:hypothetical protein X756_03325 [Mesorhizobium sp. LSHC412B00]|nr:hypothetical protein X756_03325 [Mesorhizobium sp. LSHC412B00]
MVDRTRIVLPAEQFDPVSSSGRAHFVFHFGAKPAIPGDDQSDVGGGPTRAKSRESINQHVDIFFRPEPADIADRPHIV